MPCRFTSPCSDLTMALKVCSSVSSTSSGKTSSRTNSRIHSSFFSNSGSVEKSQAIVCLPWSAGVEELVTLGDEVNDGRRPLFVHGVGPLAAPMEHQVVAEDARVLVVREGQVPAKLFRVGPVHVQQHVVRYGHRPAARDPLFARAARMRHHGEAGQVEERLAELRDLPVQQRDYSAVAKEHVAVVEVGMDE